MEQTKKRGKSRQIFKKIMRRKLSAVSVYFLIFIVLFAIIVPILTPDVFETNTAIKFSMPSLQHPLGTDELGRDVLARIAHGSRLSLGISVGSIAIALVLGSLLGLVSGYLGGKVDAVLILVIGAICSFPTILLGLLLGSLMGGGSITNVMLAIGISYTPYFARIVRSVTLSIREREYVESAVAAGLNQFEIITRYIIPNLTSVIIVQVSLNAASAIISEAALSFMGMGVQAPAASWGALLQTGYDQILVAPWLSIFPGVMIMLTVLALNFFGDGLRDALDVKIRIDT